MHNFPEQLPHGDIQEIFPDVFFVKGQIKFDNQGNTAQFSRSMTIVRDHDSLTLFNSVRLDDGALQALDRLGKVKNIVRVAAGHGRDDAFYSDRYDAPVWAASGTEHSRPVKSEATLVAGDDGPIDNATTMIFESISAAEAVVCLHRSDGILISGDSLQNIIGPDEYFDDPTAQLMEKAGFFRSGNIGPAWRARLQPELSDFERILAMPFNHLLPAHGDPLLDNAPQIIRQTVKDIYA